MSNLNNNNNDSPIDIYASQSADSRPQPGVNPEDYFKSPDPIGISESIMVSSTPDPWVPYENSTIKNKLNHLSQKVVCEDLFHHPYLYLMQFQSVTVLEYSDKLFGFLTGSNFKERILRYIVVYTIAAISSTFSMFKPQSHGGKSNPLDELVSGFEINNVVLPDDLKNYLETQSLADKKDWIIRYALYLCRARSKSLKHFADNFGQFKTYGLPFYFDELPMYDPKPTESIINCIANIFSSSINNRFISNVLVYSFVEGAPMSDRVLSNFISHQRFDGIKTAELFLRLTEELKGNGRQLILSVIESIDPYWVQTFASFAQLAEKPQFKNYMAFVRVCDTATYYRLSNKSSPKIMTLLTSVAANADMFSIEAVQGMQVYNQFVNSDAIRSAALTIYAVRVNYSPTPDQSMINYGIQNNNNSQFRPLDYFTSARSTRTDTQPLRLTQPADLPVETNNVFRATITQTNSNPIDNADELPSDVSLDGL